MAKKRAARKTRSGEPVEAGLLTTLKAVGDWLSDANVKFAVIGGVAASLHGRPRVTKDVDLVAIVAEDAWQHLLQRASRYGLEPRIGDALSFARRRQVPALRGWVSVQD